MTMTTTMTMTIAHKFAHDDDDVVFCPSPFIDIATPYRSVRNLLMCVTSASRIHRYINFVLFCLLRFRSRHFHSRCGVSTSTSVLATPLTFRAHCARTLLVLRVILFVFFCRPAVFVLALPLAVWCWSSPSNDIATLLAFRAQSAHVRSRCLAYPSLHQFCSFLYSKVMFYALPLAVWCKYFHLCFRYTSNVPRTLCTYSIGASRNSVRILL